MGPLITSKFARLHEPVLAMTLGGKETAMSDACGVLDQYIPKTRIQGSPWRPLESGVDGQ